VYIFNLLYLLVNFCLIGADILLVKKISVYDAAGKYKELKGIIIFGLFVAILGSLTVAFLSEIIIAHTDLIKVKENLNWLILAALSLSILSVTTVGQASLQGLRKIFLSQVAEKMIRPALLIILVVTIFYIEKTISVVEVIWINLFAIGVTFFVTFILFRKTFRLKIKNTPAKFEFADWTYSAASFFLLSVLYVLNSRIDIFILGLFKGNEQVGVYNIVLKISETISFGLGIVNFALSPLIAKLFANNERGQLQHVMTRSAQIVLLFSLPVVLAIVFLKESILRFFGVDILNGVEALLILSSGQFINVLFGSPGTLLIMTGNQKYSAYALIIGTAFNVLLNMALTPVYGIIGTSIATAGSLAVWNMLMYWFARRKVKIRTTAFGII
jgi:O-antigen/teichoic acid export membrane protein